MQTISKIIIASATVAVIGATVYFVSGTPSEDVSQANQTTLIKKEQKPLNEKPSNNANTLADNALPTPPPMAEAQTEETILAQADENTEYGTFQNRYTEIVARRNGRAMDVTALYEASKQPNAWEDRDEPAPSLNLSDEEKFDGREFIKFSPLKLESLVAGDTLDIHIPQTNQSFSVKIEEARANDNGRNVTWSGRSEDADSPSYITMTKGDDLIVGGISTPNGHYEIQVHGEDGWIVDSATLFKGVDKQVVVPKNLLDNPPKDPVVLPSETFGGDEH